MKRKIIYSIVNIFILLFFIEFFAYNLLVNKYKGFIEQNKQFEDIFSPKFRYSKVTINSHDYRQYYFRPVEYRNKSKSPILLFGCSFVEGFGLRDNQIFSYKLADYTDRTVFNFGQCGTGIQFFYSLLSDDSFINFLPKNTEYVIYTFIPDHLPRLYRYRPFVFEPKYINRYLIKNNKLTEDKLHFLFLHSTFTSAVIEEYVSNERFKNKEKTDELFLKLFVESDKIIKRKLPKAKFVILCYSNTSWDFPIKSELELLRKTIPDVTIIDLNDYFPELYNNSEYCISDGFHPNEKAWDLIVPFISEKLQL